MKPLYNHNSAETAYLVSDYPYGRKRCQIRFWLESDPKKGFRFCSQTEHPVKKIWNAPKKSTYNLVGGNMFLDEQGHCSWEGVSEYTSAEKALEFARKFPSTDSKVLLAWALKKAAFCKLLAEGKAGFTINGVRQERSAQEIERDKAEHDTWLECARLLKQ